MNFLSNSISQHIHDVFYGKNWTWVDLKHTLDDVSWAEATYRYDGFNTIAALTYHIHYYVAAQLQVLSGGPLDAKDKFSFDAPQITDEASWKQLTDKVWADVDMLIEKVKVLDEQNFSNYFVEEKYGTYYRNLHGMVEHTHYHLGQIVILKKMFRAGIK
jgi:hypothetical protein